MSGDTGINTDNVIGVAMEDLSDKDRDKLERDLQHELEEVMVERRKKKMVWFQRTQSSVVKKGDTVWASIPVSSSFTLEELVHMIDVLVSSKYGADLECITRTLTDSVRGSVESLRLEFKQESERLPWQIRAMVEQVLGETRGKHDVEVIEVSGASVGHGTTASTKA
jgi:hypothetical protein